MDSITWKKTEGLISAADFNLIKFSAVIPLEYVGVDKNVITYWRREGLLPFIPKGKMAKASYMQILWIWFLDALRELGTPVQRMKDVTDYFITRAVNDNLAILNLEYHKTRLEMKAKLTPLPVEDLELLMVIKRDLENPELIASHQRDINYFSNLVTESLVTGKDASILIFSDFILEYVGDKGYRTNPNRNLDFDIFHEPHIRVSLRPFLSRFVSKIELEKFRNSMNLLTDKEIQVIQYLRNNNIKTINITRANASESIRIDTTRTGVITEAQAEEIKKVLGLHNYESITLDTLDNKKLSFKHTQKHI